MSDFKDKVLFWGGLTAVSSLIIGGGYYLYKHLTDAGEEAEEKEDGEEGLLGKNKGGENIFKLSNKELIKRFGIEIREEEIFDGLNKLTNEGCIKLITCINYLAERFYQIDNPGLDEQRRNCVDNYEEYLSLCNETFMAKQNEYQIASNKVLDSLGNKISFKELQDFLQNINQKDLETLTVSEMLKQNDRLFNYNLTCLKKEEVKLAYIFYLTNFIEEADKLLNNINSKENKEENEEEQKLLMFNFLTLKMQIDDKLYLKYNVIEEQLKLMLYKNELLLDGDIVKLQEKFEKLNEKFK